MINNQLAKGTLKTVLLKVIRDGGRMYGYEITKAVKELSNNEMVLTEGALYPSLAKMVADGWLETEEVFIGKRKRKYYRLTDAGKEASAAQIKAFQSFVDVMQRLLSPSNTSYRTV